MTCTCGLHHQQLPACICMSLSQLLIPADALFHDLKRLMPLLFRLFSSSMNVSLPLFSPSQVFVDTASSLSELALKTNEQVSFSKGSFWYFAILSLDSLFDFRVPCTSCSAFLLGPMNWPSRAGGKTEAKLHTKRFNFKNGIAQPILDWFPNGFHCGAPW